ncbi:hypothetical protein EVAR_48976_1 [Eumeta japonica]|uniref:Uncharacterized protein n=1 Tax=Eumeta variegata TaxID=151549 RepID=A0A4C1Y4X3_EUMVA|nr:hypothetical protein EVAR_48976_1 [Eumeta japonica]
MPLPPSAKLNCEISGISETEGENTIHIVTLIGSKLGVSLDERDIVSAVSIATPRDYAIITTGTAVAATSEAATLTGAGMGSGGLGLRFLVVCLLRSAQRDDMPRAPRVRHNADISRLNLYYEHKVNIAWSGENALTPTPAVYRLRHTPRVWGGSIGFYPKNGVNARQLSYPDYPEVEQMLLSPHLDGKNLAIKMAYCVI